jgi:hypothetical protein
MAWCLGPGNLNLGEQNHAAAQSAINPKARTAGTGFHRSSPFFVPTEHFCSINTQKDNAGTW